MLSKHHGTNTIILIDEYDVPLDKSHQKNYYTEMVEHIRAMFSAALKTNEQELIEDSTESTKAEIETLISGEFIEKHLIPELTYADLDSTDTDIRQANLWSIPCETAVWS